MNKNKLAYLILFIFSIINISCESITKIFEKTNTKSNNLFEINFKENNQKCYIFTENNKLMFKFVNTKKRNENTIAKKQFKDIDLSSEYDVNLLNNIVFLYLDKSLYIFKIEPEIFKIEEINNIENEISYINPNEIIQNVIAILFKYKTCFYINNKRQLLIYNNNNKSLFQFNNENIIFDIILTKEYSELVKEQAKSWYGNWQKDFLNNIINKGTYNSSDDEQNILRRYYYLKKFFNNDTSKKEVYQSLDDWYKNYFLIQKEHQTNEIILKSKNFKDIWGVEPSENADLFTINVSTIKISDFKDNKDIGENIYYGKNENIKYLLMYYDNIISTYQSLISMNASNKTIKTIENIYTEIQKEIKILYDDDIRKLREYYNNFKDDINNINKAFKENIQNSILNIEIGNKNTSNNQNNIQYVFIPSNDSQPEYLMIYYINNTIQASLAGEKKRNILNIMPKDKSIILKIQDITRKFNIFTFEENNVNIMKNN